MTTLESGKRVRAEWHIIHGKALLRHELGAIGSRGVRLGIQPPKTQQVKKFPRVPSSV